MKIEKQKSRKNQTQKKKKKLIVICPNHSSNWNNYTLWIHILIKKQTAMTTTVNGSFAPTETQRINGSRKRRAEKKRSHFRIRNNNSTTYCQFKIIICFVVVVHRRRLCDVSTIRFFFFKFYFSFLLLVVVFLPVNEVNECARAICRANDFERGSCFCSFFWPNARSHSEIHTGQKHSSETVCWRDRDVAGWSFGSHPPNTNVKAEWTHHLEN